MPTLRWMAVRLKRSSSFVFFILFISLLGLVYCFSLINKKQYGNIADPESRSPFKKEETFQILPASNFLKTSTSGVISAVISVNKTQTNSQEHQKEPTLKTKRSRGSLNSKVHVFYYAWYGSPPFDGQWWHWNHEYIPPWDKNDHKIYPTGAHVPPKDVGAI